MRATSLSLSALSRCAAIVAVAAVFAIQALGANRNALRIEADNLNDINPFELVVKRTPPARHFMGDYTLVVAGMQFESGPGFILLAGSGRSGELLLDSTCAIAGT